MTEDAAHRPVETRRLPVFAAGEIDVPFVVRGTYETLRVETAWEEHAHPTHELLWAEGGAATVVVGQRTWALVPQAALWIPAGVRHRGWAAPGVRHRAAQFSIHRTRPLAEGPVLVCMEPLLRLLLDRLTQDELTDAERERSEAVVLDVLRPSPLGIAVTMPSSPLLAPLAAALTADPADRRTLRQWADELGVSSRTVTRRLEEETGAGFARWIAGVRAQRAMLMLAQGASIPEAAERTGYGDVPAFSRAFRRITGLTPAVLRTAASVSDKDASLS